MHVTDTCQSHRPPRACPGQRRSGKTRLPALSYNNPPIQTLIRLRFCCCFAPWQVREGRHRGVAAARPPDVPSDGPAAGERGADPEHDTQEGHLRVPARPSAAAAYQQQQRRGRQEEAAGHGHAAAAGQQQPDRAGGVGGRAAAAEAGPCAGPCGSQGREGQAAAVGPRSAGQPDSRAARRTGKGGRVMADVRVGVVLGLLQTRPARTTGWCCRPSCRRQRCGATPRCSSGTAHRPWRCWSTPDTGTSVAPPPARPCMQHRSSRRRPVASGQW